MTQHTPPPTLVPYTTLFRSNTRQARNVPFKFVSRMASHSDSGKLSVDIFFVRPAQFTRICTLPNSGHTDRKSTRLNSSHRTTSYAVFCVKKKMPDTARALIE